MMKFINQFVKDEDGAVTVDWVVLTAAVVGLAVAGVAAVRTGVTDVAEGIGSQLTTSADTIQDVNFGGGDGGGEEPAPGE